MKKIILVVVGLFSFYPLFSQSTAFEKALEKVKDMEAQISAQELWEIRINWNHNEYPVDGNPGYFSYFKVPNRTFKGYSKIEALSVVSLRTAKIECYFEDDNCFLIMGTTEHHSLFLKEKFLVLLDKGKVISVQETTEGPEKTPRTIFYEKNFPERTKNGVETLLALKETYKALALSLKNPGTQF